MIKGALMTLTGIDVHVHIHDAKARALQGPEAVRKFEEKARYFKRPATHVSVEEQAEQYRSRNMMAVLMNGTDVTVTGLTPVPNDFVAETVQSFPDVFMGMGVIDPWQGELARREIVRIKEMGLVGIGELNPARQHFYPNDRRFYRCGRRPSGRAWCSCSTAATRPPGRARGAAAG
jgi:predicted TIM-barrel fold metal-dependent hydrolase